MSIKSIIAAIVNGPRNANRIDELESQLETLLANQRQMSKNNEERFVDAAELAEEKFDTFRAEVEEQMVDVDNIDEKVSDALQEHDWDQSIEDVLHGYDMSDAVQEAVNEYWNNTDVRSELEEVVSEHDFSCEIEEHVVQHFEDNPIKDELHDEVMNCVGQNFDNAVGVLLKDIICKGVDATLTNAQATVDACDDDDTQSTSDSEESISVATIEVQSADAPKLDKFGYASTGSPTSKANNDPIIALLDE